MHLGDLLPERRPTLPRTRTDLGREGGLQGEELHPEFREHAFPVDSAKALGERGVGREMGVRGKGEGRGGRDRAGDKAVDDRAFAVYLARRLDDDRSLDWYRCVLRRLPREIVRDALARTLDVPPAKIRRSRAALFASLVGSRLHRHAHHP